MKAERILPPPPPPTEIRLTLSEDEAKVLYTMLAHTAYGSSGPTHKLLSNLSSELHEVGIHYSSTDPYENTPKIKRGA